MELVHHALGIGIVLVEYVLPFAVPPEPVLNDAIDRQMQITIPLCNARDFFLRFVAVLALPEAVGPPAEQRRLSGELAISGDDLVKLRAINEVVVNRVGHFGADIHHMHEAVVYPATRSIVPEDPIALRREQHRNRNIRVFLREVHRLTVIVPNAGLVLAESVEAFMRPVHPNHQLAAIGLLAIHSHWSHNATGVVEQLLIPRGKRYRATVMIDHNLHRRGRERGLLASGVQVELRCRPRDFGDDVLRTVREIAGRRIEHVDDGVGADLQLQHCARTKDCGRAFDISRNAGDGSYGRPLCPGG